MMLPLNRIGIFSQLNHFGECEVLATLRHTYLDPEDVRSITLGALVNHSLEVH